MKRDAQAVLLLLVGATLLKIGIAGTYVRYVKAGQLPLLLIAGVVLVGVAGVTLWKSIAAPRRAPAHAVGSPADPSPDPVGERREVEDREAMGGTDNGAHRSVHLAFVHADDDGFTGDIPISPSPLSSSIAPPTVAVPVISPRPSPEQAAALDRPPVDRPGVDRPAPANFVPRGAGRAARAVAEVAHAHDEPRIGWLLLVPALALLLFAPPAVGSYQANRNGTALGSQAASDFPPLAAGDPLPITMLDYAGRAVFDQGRSLAGRRIMLTGFIIAGPDGQPYLARMVVTCCAADARPIKIGLTGDVPTGLAQEQWVQVEGIFVERRDRDPVNAETIPYLQVTSLRDVPVPDEQYE